MNKYKKIILDSSALIDLIDQEEGWKMVEEVIDNAIMSSVNVSEVAKFLIDRRNYENEEVKEIIEHLVSEVIVFNTQQAYQAADLYIRTKELGLSLGDRACLALSLYTDYPVYTADKIWAKVEVENINIKLIR